MKDRALAELLLKKGLLNEKQAAKARELVDTLGSDVTFREIVVRLGYMSDGQIAQMIADAKRTAVDLDSADLDIESLSKIPEEFLREHNCIPLKHNDPGKLILALESDNDLETIESVQFMTNYLVETVIADPKEIKNRLDDIFSVSKSKKMKKIEIVQAEEKITDLPPNVLAKALADLLIEKNIITRAELFNKSMDFE